jgi:hypothetical protein
MLEQLALISSLYSNSNVELQHNYKQVLAQTPIRRSPIVRCSNGHLASLLHNNLVICNKRVRTNSSNQFRYYLEFAHQLGVYVKVNRCTYMASQITEVIRIRQDKINCD